MCTRILWTPKEFKRLLQPLAIFSGKRVGFNSPHLIPRQAFAARGQGQDHRARLIKNDVATEVLAIFPTPTTLLLAPGIVAELRFEPQLPLSPVRSCRANDLGGAEG